MATNDHMARPLVAMVTAEVLFFLQSRPRGCMCARDLFPNMSNNTVRVQYRGGGKKISQGQVKVNRSPGWLFYSLV